MSRLAGVRRLAWVGRLAWEGRLPSLEQLDVGGWWAFWVRQLSLHHGHDRVPLHPLDKHLSLHE